MGTSGPLTRLADGRYRSPSPESTAAFGEALARVLDEGDVVILEGELGAGKTQLTKGIARGLGSSGAVTSPTFTILVTHPGGSHDLHHFDLYRVDADDLDGTGILDVAGEEGVTVVEWGRESAPRFAVDWLEVTLVRDGAGDDSEEPARIISLRGEGPRGEELARLLDAELGL